MIIKFHKTHRSIGKISWKNPANILRTSREHLENIKRTSIDYLEKIQKHLWSSKNICEHLSTSEHILITYENLYRISVINWGSFEKCLHRGWLSIKFTTQLKTSENSREHWKTSKIIWYHPENNWGPIIDNLVQFEEDFNSRTKKSVGWSGPVRSGYLRPDQFLDHLTVITNTLWANLFFVSFLGSTVQDLFPDV